MFNPAARFSDLNSTGASSDHFAFHVRRLTELGLVEKREDGMYALTNTGKEFANRFDTDSEKVAFERQAKIGVLLVCARGEGSEKEYLIQQRLKQPYYGYYGFPTGKVKWGETILETAARELAEETGLVAQLTLMDIKHKMDYDEKGALLEDKYFYVVRVEHAKGGLTEKFEGGANTWLTRDAIAKLPTLFDGVDETLGIAGGDSLCFLEKKYIVSGY